MEDYIYINNNSLSPLLCKNIIEYFEEDKNTHQGQTFGGVDTEIKDTLDLMIPNENNKENKWFKIVKCLNYEILHNIKKYVKKINEPISNSQGTNDYTLFSDKPVNYSVFQIQKYIKNTGKYIYHDDAHIKWENKSQRVFTYLWYLNNIEEGGETEFWGNRQIKPECGKLLIFPASWTFPHRGKVPVSNDKYILTGWVYY